ncbi:MAG: hypothetical protein HEQ32_02975 [Vampirovibrio sp.]
MSAIMSSRRLNVLDYTYEWMKDLKDLQTLTVVVTQTNRFKNRMLNHIRFPEGLRVLAHIRNGFRIPRGVFEFLKPGDVLVFENQLDDIGTQRLVF